MADQIKMPRNVSKDEFLDQIRAGTFDAIHELMTSGSGSLSDNFYGAIKDGVREVVRATVTANQLRGGSRQRTRTRCPSRRRGA